MSEDNVIDRLMDLLEKVQSDTGSSKVLIDRFQIEQIREQERWRGGVTTELININKIQANGFEAMNKRFDKLEDEYAKDQEAANRKIGKIQSSVRRLREKNIKTAATVGFLTTLVFLMMRVCLIHLV